MRKFNWLNSFGTTYNDILMSASPWLSCYDNDAEGGDDGDGQDGDDGESSDPPADPPEGGKGKGKFMTDDQLNRLVEQRLNRERRKSLQRLQQVEQAAKLTTEERDSLRKEIEDLEKKTMTAEEIRKREEQKAKDRYEKDLNTAKTDAEKWRRQHDDLKITYEITSAAAANGALPQSLPLLSSYLRPRTKLVEQTGEDGTPTGHFVTEVEFEDRDKDNKPIQVVMSIGEVVERMRELPDLYGNLFDKKAAGGLGGHSGQNPGTGTAGFRPGMSMDEYMKARKENPSAVYGQ